MPNNGDQYLIVSNRCNWNPNGELIGIDCDSISIDICHYWSVFGIDPGSLAMQGYFKTAQAACHTQLKLPV